MGACRITQNYTYTTAKLNLKWSELGQTLDKPWSELGQTMEKPYRKLGEIFNEIRLPGSSLLIGLLPKHRLSFLLSCSHSPRL